LARLANFLVSLIIIRLLPKEEFGWVAYGITILSFLIPFTGFGLHQGFLRYGSLLKGQLDKKRLFWFSLRWGLAAILLMTLLLWALTPLLSQNLPQASIYIMILTGQLWSLYLFMLVQMYVRIIHLNQIYASMDAWKSGTVFVLCIAGSFLFGGVGYVLGLVLAPLIVALYFMQKVHLFQAIPAQFPSTISTWEYTRYGLLTSLSNILSQLLYAVDILLIGNLLESSELVAQYKATNIIPFSLAMIPLAIMATDFVKLSRSSQHDKAYVKEFYWNYLKLFSLLSIGIAVVFYFGAPYFLLLFGPEYAGYESLMHLFTLGMIGGILFRIPLGNILSAIGWPQVNALISFLILVINLIASYFMILEYGIYGAAAVTASLMWLSGLISLGVFVYWGLGSGD